MMLPSARSPLTSPTTTLDMVSSLPTPPAESAPMPKRDKEFYCRDVVFLVEGVLYRVSRGPFERSSGNMFSGMFQIPAQNHEGESDEHPIELETVSGADFKAFLRVLFPGIYSPERSLTTDEWMGVLKLATMWMFDAVRAVAISQLHKLLIRSPALRVRFAREFDIPLWIQPALLALARQDTLTAADLEALGWDTTAKLIRVREGAVTFAGHCACACPTCNHAHGTTRGQAGGRPDVVTAAMVRQDADLASRITEVFGPNAA
ncbi:hypothetical protein C8Q79DRAFT_956099 [Trametes meyenii]|nr:hypothetical protein C8Q79DRAFT_956099 [Trametes meyenii]